MHDIKRIVEDFNGMKSNLEKRNFDTTLLDKVIQLNQKRKELTTSVETSRAEIKRLSREVGKIKKEGGDASEIMGKVSSSKKAILDNEEALEKTKEEMNAILMIIPNLISDEVPIGKSEDENVESFKWGAPTELSFQAKDHVELGENLGYFDFEAAAEMTGARFVVSKGPLAKMERALVSFMIDQHTDKGFLEILPPYIVHERSMLGTGQLPKFKDDAFKIENFDWYLIPTAEVPLVNLKRGKLFDRKELPYKYVASTPCFRSEAGSYGKDTRGIIRVHQFSKVELVAITEASKADDMHKEIVDRACSILELLKIPYRGVTLCSGDIGFGSYKCIDLEAWLPAQNRYREISSISNCGDFQGRRANIRYRGESGKPEFAHTLNGSGLAIGRTLVAIMENYQNENGTITIPEVLVSYMGGMTVIE